MRLSRVTIFQKTANVYILNWGNNMPDITVEQQ